MESEMIEIDGRVVDVEYELTGPEIQLIDWQCDDPDITEEDVIEYLVMG